MNRHCPILACLSFAATLPAQPEPLPTMRVERQAYAAEFSPERVEFRVGMSSAAEATPRLQLRYLGARRSGGASLARSPEAAPQRRRDRGHDDVRYDHGGVVKVYRIGETGFELSFRLAARPDVDGDPGAALGVSGNVTGARHAARHQELVFAHAGGSAIRYGEAIAFDRRGERVDVRTAYDGEGRIELVVPADFVDRAVYPLVVDPTVTPIWALSPAGGERHPEAAYAAVYDRYITTFSHFSAGTYSVRCMIVDGSGPFSSGTVASGLTSQPQAAVADCRATAPFAFLVVWRQNGAIWGRLVAIGNSTAGTPLAPAFVINSPGPGESCGRPTVTSADDVGLVVAWELTFAGESSPRSIRSRELHWPNPGNPAGVSVGPQRILETVTSGYVQNARFSKCSHARWVSGGYWAHCRLVWERFYSSPAPGDFDVRTCSFRARPATAQFTMMQAPSTVLPGGSIYDDDMQPDIGSLATVFFDPTDQLYCIAWNSAGDVYATMYDDQGAVGPVFPVRATGLDESQPRVGAGACEFTIAYGEATSPTSTQLDIRDGTVPADHVLVDSQGNALRERLAISSRPIHPAVAYPINRTLIVWENSYQFDGVIGRMFEPVAPSLNPYGSACPGPLGEMPAISTFATPYAGNSNFGVYVSNAPANSLAVLLVGDVLTTAPIPGAPGCNLYVGLPWITVLPTLVNATGGGGVPLPMPCSIPAGLTIACQWGIYSPTSNAFGWIVSNDLDITWNH